MWKHHPKLVWRCHSTRESGCMFLFPEVRSNSFALQEKTLKGPISRKEETAPSVVKTNSLGWGIPGASGGFLFASRDTTKPFIHVNIGNTGYTRILAQSQ